MSRSQTDHPGFAETLRALNGAQKPGHGVPAYTRWVNRRAARVFAAGAVALGIGPNGVTAVSALLSAGAITVLLLADPTVLTAVIAALLFALGYAMDSADGQVARVTGASSPGGEWLDHVVDSVRVPAIHLTVAVGFLRHPEHFPGHGWGSAWMPLLFCVVAVGHFMSQILAEQLRRTRRTAAPSSGGTLRSFLNLHMDAGTLCWIFLLWGFGTVFVIAYGLLLAATVLTVAVSMRRKYQSLNTPGDPS